MKVIYVAGKYSGGNEYEVKKNITTAEAAAVAIWKTLKASAVCPHLNTAHWGSLLTHQQFIDGDLAIMERCDAVLFLERWQESKGARLEHNHAIKNNMVRLYSVNDALHWLNEGDTYGLYSD